ncbi:MAG: hypothetical protein ACI4KG_03000 [Oscillospiraceae bacterium]
MKNFTIPANQLYYLSESAFFALLPNCEANFVHDSTQMWFNLGKVARYGSRKQRLEAMAHIITYASDSKINEVKIWLNEYFSPNMQSEIFGLTVSESLEIIPDKALERAINKLSKSNRKR